MQTGLFGSSGLRGVVNKDLTPILAVKVGLALGTFTKAGKICVARDTRLSGLIIENALVSGLLACGSKVYCLGVLPTPVLAYLTMKLEADAGVIITASHNPPQYNGIKIFDANGMAYGEKNQSEIEEIVEREKFRLADWRNLGENIALEDKSGLYLDMVQESVKLEKEWHVVVDPGCGATSKIAPAVFRSLKCKVTPINANPDGLFPGRSPEPNADSLKLLAKIVRELRVDVGVAYDGDGDRAAFLDENGDFVDFDRVLATYAAYALKKGKGKTVVTNVEASMCVEKMAEPYGGKVVRTKVGDVYVAEAVKRFNAVFGGEPCGAWIHPKFHFCPDGILSSVLLLKALEDEGKSLSEFVAETPAYPVLRENVPCKNEAKYAVVGKVEEVLKVHLPKYKQISTVDGVRLALEEGWVLVRASGTEPLLRLTVEGESLKAAENIMEKAVAVVKEIVEDFER
ncbi:MAG: phosphoglucosamine mutase [Candidatus Bathyarchaeales archaeon]